MNVIYNDTESWGFAESALKAVLDPEIELNVIDLGLIYQFDIDKEAKKIFCRMGLTTRFCPMGDSIQQAVHEALQTQFPAYKIIVELSFDPPWNSARISPAGREFLNR